MDVKAQTSRAKCRPCCSIPGGRTSILAGIFGTIALACSLTASYTCHYVYAQVEYCSPPAEPEPHYACCGDCHCIVTDSSSLKCPETVPMMNISDATLQRYQTMELTNPMNLTCNPYDTQYTGVPCETTPPQVLTELGDDAVCGATYDTETLDSNQCPTRYSLETYRDMGDMQAAGAVLTHWGACGVCSTTQDLAVYIAHTDLTTLGVQCSIAGILEFEQGVRCYQRVGYTRACAEMWVYNGLQTKDYCGKLCARSRLEKRPNNGPAPQCKLEECLQCDEDNSGPLFIKVAARSRRRSGLLSKIARPCDAILFVNHQNPCDVVQNITKQYTQSNVCDQIDPNYDPTPKCSPFDGGLGIFSHTTVTTSKGLFSFDITLIPNDEIFTTYYGVCTRYDTRRALHGYWEDMADDYLGTPWKVARIFSVLSSIFGIILVICTWSAAGCIACRPVFWHIMGGGYLLVGIFDLLTLSFLKSSVCTTQGCQFGYGAAMAILAGVFWFVSGSLCFVTAAKDMGGQDLVITSRVEITEYVEPDGVRITETTKIQSNGTTMIQRTVRKPTVLASPENETNSSSDTEGDSNYFDPDPEKDKGE